MSKRRKGKKHRTINRTPRPVGSSQSTRARRARTAAPAAVTDLAAAVAPVPDGGPAPARPEPQIPAPTRPGGPALSPVEAYAAVFTSARDGGLGRAASRTWQELEARGASGAPIEELTEAAGYQSPTVLKHLKGLTAHGMAEQRGDRWYTAAGSDATTADEARGLQPANT
ncbi:hypothetical protein [Streptomyces sp. H27-D2]|uniref:hypothetical protein n=1 Tax=Streptomyces sp. H27-D2 TaxID=3046304 RepID=UPI002DBDAFD2|nr:hypothetical protein [Streptomyces sp. H27-D2]MEC4019374.1 hypothetical protein [Streptomyces sp. H27-D2]